jgi:Leucine-rich repeat (LRR) protein
VPWFLICVPLSVLPCIFQELGLLTNLHSLDIKENKLSGTIPSELFLLTRLKVFELDNNVSAVTATKMRRQGSHV